MYIHVGHMTILQMNDTNNTVMWQSQVAHMTITWALYTPPTGSLHHGVLLVVFYELGEGVKFRPPAHVKSALVVPYHDVAHLVINPGWQDVESGIVHGGSDQKTAILAFAHEQRLCLPPCQVAMVPPGMGSNGWKIGNFLHVYYNYMYMHVSGVCVCVCTKVWKMPV